MQLNTALRQTIIPQLIIVLSRAFLDSAPYQAVRPPTRTRLTHIGRHNPAARGVEPLEPPRRRGAHTLMRIKMYGAESPILPIARNSPAVQCAVSEEIRTLHLIRLRGILCGRILSGKYVKLMVLLVLLAAGASGGHLAYSRDGRHCSLAVPRRYS